jgi:hypothetical protein
MDSKDVVIDALGRIQRILSMSLEGLSAEQLTYRPTVQANSIAWLGWHLTRVQDKQISDLAARPQAWIADGWHSRFDKPADPLDTGQRYTPEQVAAVRPAYPSLLLDYYDAVYQRSVANLQNVSPTDMDRVLDEPQNNPLPTVGVRLVSIAADNLQHAGQIAYLRGLIEDRRWYPA